MSPEEVICRMWTLLGHWDIVGHFSEGCSRRVISALLFLCALLLSLSICFVLMVSFPLEQSCPFLGHILYSVFLFMRFILYLLTILQAFQCHPGLWLPLRCPFQDS